VEDLKIFAKKLKNEQYAVFIHDTQGFGASEGDRGHIEDWIYLVDDQLQFIEQVGKLFPSFTNLPVFLLGEDIGALTVIQASQRKSPNFFKGLILANIPLTFTTELPSAAKPILNKLNEYAPKLPFWPIESYISTLPEVVKSYENDPLVYQGWLRVRFYNELQKTSQKVLNNLFHIKTPLLVLQGTGTTNVNPEGSTQLYNVAVSQDKTIKKYDGQLTQLFEDKDKEKVIKDTIEWLNIKSTEAKAK